MRRMVCGRCDGAGVRTRRIRPRRANDHLDLRLDGGAADGDLRSVDERGLHGDDLDHVLDRRR